MVWGEYEGGLKRAGILYKKRTNKKTTKKALSNNQPNN